MKNFICEEEKTAIKKSVELADVWGYGNIIHRLHIAWALKLLKEYGVTVKSACLGAHMSKKDANYYDKKWGKDKDGFIKACEEYIGA